jgi:MarR family transcriptional regulator for hemolysin
MANTPPRTVPDLTGYLTHAGHVLETQLSAALAEVGLTLRMQCVLRHALERTKSADDCPDCLADNLSWLLTQAHFNLISEIAAAFEPLGVSNRGYHVLATAEAGEFTQKELAERIGLDKTTMVVTVDALEKAGYAERKPSATDRRARIIAVTEAGAKIAHEGQRIVDRVHAEALEALAAGQRQPFVNALAHLVDGHLSTPVEAQPVRRARQRAS